MPSLQRMLRREGTQEYSEQLFNETDNAWSETDSTPSEHVNNAVSNLSEPDLSKSDNSDSFAVV